MLLPWAALTVTPSQGGFYCGMEKEGLRPPSPCPVIQDMITTIDEISTNGFDFLMLFYAAIYPLSTSFETNLKQNQSKKAD